jgi:hypothetical protein
MRAGDPVRAYTAICATLACILAGAALAVSLTHSGPRGLQGPAGPQGTTGRNAQIAHLGLCWQFTNDTTTGDVSGVYLGAPTLSDGVPSCPSGQFISIVPQPATAGAGG